MFHQQELVLSFDNVIAMEPHYEMSSSI